MEKMIIHRTKYYADSLVHSALAEPISFPQVVLCAFKVRVVGNVQRHVVQCSLIQSEFHASLLLFIWFFLFVVAWLTAIGTVVFLFEFLLGGCIGREVLAIVSDDDGRGLKITWRWTPGDHWAMVMRWVDDGTERGSNAMFILSGCGCSVTLLPSPNVNGCRHAITGWHLCQWSVQISAGACASSFLLIFLDPSGQPPKLLLMLNFAHL